ncbi:hypothetical protein [Sphingomonas sp. Leaf257]|uniref:hypothetical protein n=1 Tax=Sphingomonas sp. Leaf257 TaxID=1736309 RepID=UPI000ADF3AF6|nr:hypothetical protein [Sphingomonas sp. Leaf257]
MIGVTFASDARPAYPRLRDQWSHLAQASEQFLADRRAKDPAAITKGVMKPDEARQRERVMAAVVAIWRDVETLSELEKPSEWPHLYGASLPEIQVDLRGVAKATAAVGRDRTMIECAAALAWQFEPVAPGSLPHIWIAADHVLYLARTDREAA